MSSEDGPRCLRIRGVPFNATEKDVRDFFKGLDVTEVCFDFNSDGRPSGECYCKFGNDADVDVGMTKDRQSIGRRYIEIFRVGALELSNYERKIENGRKQPADGSHGYVQVHGLPFKSGEKELVDFFKDCKVEEVVLGKEPGERGRPTGEAYVRFASNDEAAKAMLRNGQHLGQRYLELRLGDFHSFVNYKRKMNGARPPALFDLQPSWGPPAYGYDEPPFRGGGRLYRDPSGLPPSNFGGRRFAPYGPPRGPTFDDPGRYSDYPPYDYPPMNGYDFDINAAGSYTSPSQVGIDRYDHYGPPSWATGGGAFAGEYDPRDIGPSGPRDAGPYGPRDAGPYGPRDAGPYGPREAGSYGPRDAGPYGPREAESYDPRDVGPYGPRRGGYGSTDAAGTYPSGVWDTQQSHHPPSRTWDAAAGSGRNSRTGQPSAEPLDYGANSRYDLLDYPPARQDAADNYYDVIQSYGNGGAAADRYASYGGHAVPNVPTSYRSNKADNYAQPYDRLVHDGACGRNGYGKGGDKPGGLLGLNLVNFDYPLPPTKIYMRGVPFRVAATEIEKFFAPLICVEIKVGFYENGRSTGDGVVEFESAADAEKALKKDHLSMGTRYIELFSPSELSRAMLRTSDGAMYKTIGGKNHIPSFPWSATSLRPS